MSRSRRRAPEPRQDLDLAPIMNIVMILIPLLLLSTVFIKTGIVPISSPGGRTTAAADPDAERVQVPRVVVTVTERGFSIADRHNMAEFQRFSAPTEGCPQGDDAATICLRDDVPADAELLERLDYAALYDRMVEIRLQPAWSDAFDQDPDAARLSLLADPEVPFEALIQTMDATRHVLVPADGAATPVVGAWATHVLGDGATLDDLRGARMVRVNGTPAPLFPDPVLLLPRPGA